MDRGGNLLVASFASLALHALFFLLATASPVSRAPFPPLDIELYRPDEARERFPAPPDASAAGPAEAPREEPVPRPERQIVSPPDSPEAKPDFARLLSDRDSRAEEETVKRGEPAPPAEPPRTREQAEERKAASEAPRSAPPHAALGTAPLPGLGDLFARPADLLRDPSIRQGDAPHARAQGATVAKIQRPDLWADPGDRGTPDYLPDVRQGQFTLLNTKADLFAPFVRRVGLRVFQTFSMDFKRQILAGQVPQGNEQVEIEAVMSPGGRRLQVGLKSRSGNLATDRVLLATLSDDIFFDENPPRGALADDGRIHFLFALDARVWYQTQEGGGLQPGARWIFGAGLL